MKIEIFLQRFFEEIFTPPDSALNSERNSSFAEIGFSVCSRNVGCNSCYTHKTHSHARTLL